MYGKILDNNEIYIVNNVIRNSIRFPYSTSIICTMGTGSETKGSRGRLLNGIGSTRFRIAIKSLCLEVNFEILHDYRP